MKKEEERGQREREVKTGPFHTRTAFHTTSQSLKIKGMAGEEVYMAEFPRGDQQHVLR